MTDLSDITNDLTQENLRLLVRGYFDAWEKAKTENERLTKYVAELQDGITSINNAGVARTRQLEAENERLRAIEQKARVTEAKLTKIFDHDAYTGVFMFYEAHGFSYAGPTVEAELNALRDALQVEP